MVDAKVPSRAKRRSPTRPTPKPKSVVRPTGKKVDEGGVEIVPRNGRKGKGDGTGGEYWEVRLDGRRVGEVFVNVIDEPPIGRHASLQIFLNKTEQGRGVGRIAYRQAAEASRHDPVYLHMRKSNLASRISAEAAGFVDASPSGFAQLIMQRSRGG